MNKVIENLSCLITGSQSPYYTQELKPYLLLVILNTIGLLGLKVVKIVAEVYFQN